MAIILRANEFILFIDVFLRIPGRTEFLFRTTAIENFNDGLI
jgi:hypothetical protein